MATAMARTGDQRPRPILLALILTAVNALGGIIYALAAPDLDDRGTVVTVSVVIGAIMLAFAAWLWTGSRWGAIGTIVINAFNIFLGVPGFFTEDGAVIAGLVVSVALSLATIACTWLPESRIFWRRASA